MKISKFTIAALLTMGLVVTGCVSKKTSNSGSQQPSSSSSTSIPAVVTDIEITPVGRTLLVGDQINLDDYVNVVGGEGGPKAFNAAVRPGSEGLVTLEGKTVTVVAEGTFKIDITAGTESNIFEATAMTALRAAFKDYIDNFPLVYGVQRQTYNAGEIVDVPNEVVVHQEDYIAHYAWEDTDPKVGGFLKAGDGKIYQWSASDMAGTNFKPIPGPVAAVSSWGNYFINHALYFKFSDYQMTDYPESTEKVLAITDAALAQPDLVEYFDCAIDQLMYCALGFDFGDDINKTLYVHATEKPSGGFDFNFELIYTDTNGTESTTDDHVYGFPFRFLLGDAAPELAYVQAYVDSGEHPEAVSFAEFTTVSSAAVAAKNYSYEITVGFFNTSSFGYYDPSLTPQILTALGVPEAQIDYYANNAFYSLSESGVVTSSARYASVTEIEFTDGAISATPTSEHGYMEHEGALYHFSRSGGLGDYTTQNTGVATLWSDASAYAGANMIPNSSFEVSSRTDNGDGSFTFSFAQGSASIAQLGEVTAKLGKYNYYSSSQLQYMLGKLIVTADAFQFTFGTNYGGGIMWGARLTVAGIGSAVCPVAEDVIFPTA